MLKSVTAPASSRMAVANSADPGRLSSSPRAQDARSSAASATVGQPGAQGLGADLGQRDQLAPQRAGELGQRLGPAHLHGAQRHAGARARAGQRGQRQHGPCAARPAADQRRGLARRRAAGPPGVQAAAGRPLRDAVHIGMNPAPPAGLAGPEPGLAGQLQAAVGLGQPERHGGGARRGQGLFQHGGGDASPVRSELGGGTRPVRPWPRRRGAGPPRPRPPPPSTAGMTSPVICAASSRMLVPESLDRASSCSWACAAEQCSRSISTPRARSTAERAAAWAASRSSSRRCRAMSALSRRNSAPLAAVKVGLPGERLRAPRPPDAALAVTSLCSPG